MTKQARINFRLTNRQRAAILSAADNRDQSVTDFILELFRNWQEANPDA